jgi:hypothetical protein
MRLLRIQINRFPALAVLLVLWSTACGGPGEAYSEEQSAPAGGREQQSEMLLTWARYGGFAGFCDEMRVSVGGEVRIQSCRPKTEKVGKLSTEDMSRLAEWRKSFASVVIESSDGPVADGMSVKLTLKGTGSGQPGDAQRREILDWAQRVFSGITRL